MYAVMKCVSIDDRQGQMRVCWWGWWGVGLLREAEVVTTGSCIVTTDVNPFCLPLCSYDIVYTPLLFGLSSLPLRAQPAPT